MSRSFSWVRRPLQPIGLDLGTRFVRMLQVACHKGHITVTGCAQQEIAPGAYAPADLDEIRVQTVRSLLASGQFTGRDAVIALPWEQLQLRTVRVPPMPEADLAETVRFEAADRFGFEPEKYEVRFIPAGDVRQGHEVRQEVIVLGAERSVVNGHIGLLARMGLRPAAIDAAPGAFFRGFERFLRRDEDQGEANVFIDMGYLGTRVAISRGSELIFVKSIPIGGRRFDELVAESLSLSPHEAVQIRRRLRDRHLATATGQATRDHLESTVGENVRRSVLDAIRPALEQLSKEISLCVRYCSVTFRGPCAEAITAVGGEASDGDILQVLSNQVNIPFHTGRPMRNITLETEADGADRRAGQPDWATALGLALKPVAPLEDVERGRVAAEVGA